MKLGPYNLNTIITGDARELTKKIPDESIDFIITDPVYDRIEDYEWLAQESQRILKPKKSVVAFCKHVMFENAILFKDAGMKLNPLLDHAPNGSCGRMWVYKLQMNGIPAIWASRGIPDSKFQMLRYFGASLKGARGFKWAKNPDYISYRIGKFTEEFDTVFDPFSGGGTVPAVCKIMQRLFLAFEIDPGTAENARERLNKTQNPLPMKFEQATQKKFDI